MPTITYTANLQRHIDCRPQQVKGGTVREALDAAFAANTKARGYVLDEHGAPASAHGDLRRRRGDPRPRRSQRHRVQRRRDLHYAGIGRRGMRE